MTRVKICGLSQVDHALAAAVAGADMLGFVFAPSRRRVEPERAREIIAAVRERFSPQMAGVFVNETREEMNRIARLCGLDWVQLSGHEPAEVATALDVPTIDVVHVDDGTDVARKVNESRGDVVLLDTARAGAYGGTGEPFDWSRVSPLERRIMLAGGLHAGNVGEALRAIHPWGVDVSSGVESNGVKDPDRIRAFVAGVREVDGERWVHAGWCGTPAWRCPGP